MLMLAVSAPALAGKPEPVFDGRTASEWADAMDADGDREGWSNQQATPPTYRLQEGGEEAFSVLDALLRDTRPRVRALTCQNVLGRMGPRSRHLYADPVSNWAVRRLFDMLEDREAMVRVSALPRRSRPHAVQRPAQLHAAPR